MFRSNLSGHNMSYYRLIFMFNSAGNFEYHWHYVLKKMQCITKCIFKASQMKRFRSICFDMEMTMHTFLKKNRVYKGQTVESDQACFSNISNYS